VDHPVDAGDSSSDDSDSDETFPLEEVGLEETLLLARSHCDLAIRRAMTTTTTTTTTVLLRRKARVAELASDVLETLRGLPTLKELDDKQNERDRLMHSNSNSNVQVEVEVEATAMQEFQGKWRQAEAFVKSAIHCLTGAEHYEPSQLEQRRCYLEQEPPHTSPDC
jgi:hypothetical protein